MRVELLSSGFISPERTGTDGTNAPKVPPQNYLFEGVQTLNSGVKGLGLFIAIGAAYLLLKNSGRRRNGTSERGSVMAVSGERGVRQNPSTSSRTRTEVRSPTSTRTEVRSPTSTSTSTRAHTSGNFTATVTGGAGRGNTSVTIRGNRGRAKRRR